MGLGCGANCLKVVLIIFNVIFFLAGGAALGLGIWMAVDEDAFDILGIANPEGTDYIIWSATVYTMIGVGAFIFLVGGLGMAGACCNNKCMLMTYAVLTGVALAAEITCAVLAIVYKDEINGELEKTMYEDLTGRYTTVDDDGNSYVSTWNNFQTKMKCCGSYNFTDWANNTNYGPSEPTETVPWTCCKMDQVSDPPLQSDVTDIDACYLEGRSTNPADQPGFNYLNNKGCHEALSIWVEDQTVIIIGVMFGLVGLQILGIIFGCLLFCAVDDKVDII